MNGNRGVGKIKMDIDDWKQGCRENENRDDWKQGCREDKNINR